MNISGHCNSRSLPVDKRGVEAPEGKAEEKKTTWFGRKASIVKKNDSHQSREGASAGGLSTKGKVAVCATALLNFAGRSSALHPTESPPDTCLGVTWGGAPSFPPFPPFLGPGEQNEGLKDEVCAEVSRHLINKGICSSSTNIECHPACIHINDWYGKTCETVQDTISTQVSITPQVNITDTTSPEDSEFNYLPIIVTCIVVFLGLISALAFFCYYRSSNSVKNTGTEEENMSMKDIEKSGESDVEENIEGSDTEIGIETCDTEEGVVSGKTTVVIEAEAGSN